MRTIILEVPDEDYDLIEAAFCEQYGYKEVSQTPVSDKNGMVVGKEETPNPQTKEAFVVVQVVNFLTAIVNEVTLRRLKVAARTQADEVSARLTITHKTDK